MDSESELRRGRDERPTAPVRLKLKLEPPLIALAQALMIGLVAAWSGYGAAWVAVVLLVLLGVSGPLLARRANGVVAVFGPARITTQVGAARPVELELVGHGRDLLLRLGEGARIERARRRAVPDLSWSAGSTASNTLCELRMTRRGRFDGLELEVASSFPLGLCTARRILRLDCDVLVRPRPLRKGPWSRVALRRERGATLGALPDPIGEFYALADWRPGESTRRLRFGPSLRRGKLLREETASSGAEVTTILLIAHRECSPAAFERAVSAATTLVTELAQVGRPVELRVVWPSVLGRAAPSDRFGDEPAREDGDQGRAAARGRQEARARAAQATRTVRGSRAALDELAAVQPRGGDLRVALESLDDLYAGALVVIGLDLLGSDGRHPWFGPLAAASRALWLVCEPSGDPALLGQHTRSRRGAPRGARTARVAR